MSTEISEQSPSTSLPPSLFVPLEPTQVSQWRERYPRLNGEGIVIGVMDTGCDFAEGLRSCPNDPNRPKIIDVVDATGSGDVDCSHTQTLSSENQHLTLLSGRSLLPPSHWNNPSQSYYIGLKKAYDLFPEQLKNRIKKERKEKFLKRHNEEIAKLKADINNLSDKKDVEKQVRHLETLMEKYNDCGPLLDCICWFDGEVYRCVICTPEDDEHTIAKLPQLTDYYIEHEYATFSSEDLLNYAVNIYENGKLLSIVTTAGSHGTHVAGIIGAYYPDNPELNGIAPGAQIVSIKIGDSRLGSMETGTGLIRGMIAAKRAGCHIVNLSYGEPSSMVNYGRIAKTIQNFVNEEGIIFVTSAGNSGPGLSTIGAPASLSSAVISVGAHVSTEMMESQYSLREPLPSNQYTWSSRGPTVDGGLGVSVSAPGCSITCVPTYTLQRNQRMNGTSMSAPSTTGAIALLLHGMKDLGLSWNPSYIKRAIENTALPVHNVHPLALGNGLVQIDSAFEYVQKFPYNPDYNMWIDVECGQKKTRGVYLRELHQTEKSHEERIVVKPKFQKESDNTTKITFDKRVFLRTEQEWIQTPKFVQFSNTSNTFSILVDPRELESNCVHLGEVLGLDCENPDEGPLFRIPVIVTKPASPSTFVSPHKYDAGSLLLNSGQICRSFIKVPDGARSARIRLDTGVDRSKWSPDTRRIFMLHAIQLLPKSSFNTVELKRAFHMSCGEQCHFDLNVIPNRTLEVTLAQFWSSLGTSSVGLSVEFYGAEIVEELHMTESVKSFFLHSKLRSEDVGLKASFDRVCRHVRPSNSEIFCRNDERNKLFTKDKYIHEMILTYNFSLDSAADVLVRIPVVNSLLYEAEYEAQMIMIFNKNKELLKVNDFKPTKVKLQKGDYTVRVHLRHDKLSLLERKKNMVIVVERDISAISSDIYGDINGALTRSKKGKVSKLALKKDKMHSLYLVSPKTDKVKGVKEGYWIAGELKVTNNDNITVSSSKIVYHVPPSPIKKKSSDSEKEKEEFEKLDDKSISEKLKDALLDERVKFARDLLKKKKYEDLNSLLTNLMESFSRDLRVLTLNLDALHQQYKSKENNVSNQDVLPACDLIVKCIDIDEMAIHYGTKPKHIDSDDYALQKKCQEFDKKKKFLVDALHKKCLVLFDLDDSDEQKESVTKAVKELRKWHDTKSVPYVLVEMKYSRMQGNHGEALKLLEKYVLSESHDAPTEFLEEVSEIQIAIYEKLGWDFWKIYSENHKLVRFPKGYPVF